MEEEEEDAAGDFALNLFFTQTGSLTKTVAPRCLSAGM